MMLETKMRNLNTVHASGVSSTAYIPQVHGLRLGGGAPVAQRLPSLVDARLVAATPSGDIFLGLAGGEEVGEKAGRGQEEGTGGGGRDGVEGDATESCTLPFKHMIDGD